VNAIPTDLAELHDTDFYAWARHQADALRRLKALHLNADLDLDHVAEEIDDLAASARRSVRSQVRHVLEHFLKLRFSPAAETRGAWQRSIVEARIELSEDLTTTLRNELMADFEGLYAQARKAAAKDLMNEGEAEAARLLPETCPWSLDDVLRDDWYPAPNA
jgi:hypothetical protein